MHEQTHQHQQQDQRNDRAISKIQTSKNNWDVKGHKLFGRAKYTAEQRRKKKSISK